MRKKCTYWPLASCGAFPIVSTLQKYARTTSRSRAAIRNYYNLLKKICLDTLFLLSIGYFLMEQEYILYCDESEKNGKFYSDFYGGVLVGVPQYEGIVLKLEKEKLGLFGEVKWSKITSRDRALLF